MKMKRNILVAVLSCVLAIGLIPTSAFAVGNESQPVNTNVSASVSLEGEGSESNPYQIEDAEDLKEFASVVNDGELAACAELTANIDLNPGITFNEDGSYNGGTPEEWTTIKDYSGTFNGNNKTIRGLYINNSSEYQGLFGKNIGTIKNLGIIESYVSAKKYVGSIVGRNGKGTVENCYNKGFVNGEGSIGGVAGYTYGTVQNCYNTGNITSSGNGVGGVTSYSETLMQNCYNTGTVTGAADTVGGVLGSAVGSVENCYNTGDVIGTGNYSWETNVGGVTGSCGSYSRACTITNCYNTGNVSGGNSLSGGVSGKVGRKGEIVNCYNTGNITSQAYAGGVTGENNNGTLKFCHNTGDVQAKTGAGPIAGKLTGTYTVENVYYLSDTEVEDGGMTKEQFESGEVAWLLNENQPTAVWKQNIDNGEEKSDYPVLAGGEVYKVKKYATCDKSDTPVEAYSNTEADILGAHSFGDWEVTAEPTCTQPGMQERVCVLCNHRETKELVSLGHNAVRVEAKEATCTEDGNIEYWYCDTCGKYFSDEDLTKEISKEETLLKNGHDVQLTNAKEATCTEEGYTGDKVCSICGKVVEKGTMVAKKAHSFQDGTCTVCGAADPNDVPVEDGNTDKPETGDSSNVALWLILLLSGIGVMSGAMTVLRRKNKIM